MPPTQEPHMGDILVVWDTRICFICGTQNHGLFVVDMDWLMIIHEMSTSIKREMILYEVPTSKKGR